MKKKSSKRNSTPDSPWGKPRVSGPCLKDNLNSGRMLAWFCLQQHDETGRFATEILNELDAAHDLTSQDRGLAVDLVAGVLRRRRTIDTILESQIQRARANVEPDLWRLLQLGVYQVVFARTPDHAAVDTTVELARIVGCSRWCGFANGVLRNVSRLLTEQTTPLPAANALPRGDQTFVLLEQPIFPSPTDDSVEYFGTAFSLPRSLARRWTGRFCEADLLRICFYGLDIPALCLRVNRLTATVTQVQSALEERGIEVSPGSNAWSLRLKHAARVTELPGYQEGWWSVQDESAMAASELVAPVPGERILDLCAAPGGKAGHLAELSEDAAEIIACDVSEHRLTRIAENKDRLKLTSVHPRLISRDGNDLSAGPFDAALVDVPCSNTGVLSRRPEARWRFREDELQELVQLQTRLLLAAFERLRPGGRLVYSTCSIEPEETSELVKNLTTLIPDLTLSHEQLLLPGQAGDGAYQALLRKT